MFNIYYLVKDLVGFISTTIKENSSISAKILVKSCFKIIHSLLSTKDKLKEGNEIISELLQLFLSLLTNPETYRLFKSEILLQLPSLPFMILPHETLKLVHQLATDEAIGKNASTCFALLLSRAFAESKSGYARACRLLIPIMKKNARTELFTVNAVLRCQKDVHKKFEYERVGYDKNN